MVTVPDLPTDGVTVAAMRVATEMRKQPLLRGGFSDEQFRALAFDLACAALDAGAPAIRADERRCILRLAAEHKPVYYTGNAKDGIEQRPFEDVLADLIGESP